MAKQANGVIRLQGTIGGITYVQSNTYDDHIRAARGSIKPALLNATLQQHAGRTAALNRQASEVHNGLKLYSAGFKEGQFWQALQKQLRVAGTTDPYQVLQALKGLD